MKILTLFYLIKNCITEIKKLIILSFMLTLDMINDRIKEDLPYSIGRR